MPKKQTFISKTTKKKKPQPFKSIKVVYGFVSKEKRGIRFSEKFVKVPSQGDEIKAIESNFQNATAS